MDEARTRPDSRGIPATLGSDVKPSSLAAGAALALLACLLFLPNLGTHELWDPDEPRYALVSREMLRNGDALVPRQNGRIYTQKPPMLFWLQSGLASIAGGHSPWVSRLPAALGAIGSVILTWRMGVNLFCPLAGLAAAVVFATAHLVQWNGHTGTMDSLLSFWIALAAWLFARILREPVPPPTTLWLAYAALGCAALTKGPAAVLMLIAAVVAVRWAWQGRTAALAVRPGTGLAIVTAVCLFWLVPAGIRGGAEYVEAIAYRQTVVRFLNPWHHYHGPAYYLGMLPLDFLPWTFFLPAGSWAAWRRWKTERDPGSLFPLLWVGLTVFFFSLSPGKRNVYLLPCFPALALLTGQIIHQWFKGKDETWLLRCCLAVNSVFLLAGGAVAVACWRKYTPIITLGTGFACLAAGLFVLQVRAHRLRRGGAALITALTTTAVIWVYFYTLIMPACDYFRSARPFARAVAAQVEPAETLASYILFKPSVAYYLDRRILEIDPSPASRKQLVDLASQTPGGLACLMPKSMAETEPREAGLKVLDRIDGQGGARSLVFLRLGAVTEPETGK